MKTIDVFLCSKPLQYFNVKNISCCRGNLNYLFLLKSFYKADDFAKKIIKYDRNWDKIIVSKSLYFLLFRMLFLRIDKLFSWCDTGFIYKIFCFIKRCSFLIYEEGTGTYVNTIQYSRWSIKRKLQKFAGITDTIGYSQFTSGSYVYDTDKYLQKKITYDVFPFKKQFYDFLKESKGLFLKLSYINDEEIFSFRGKKILIYLTSWTINSYIMSQLKKERNNYDFVFIKPHPHISKMNFENYDFKVIKTNLMVEFILEILICNNNKVTCYHEGTSAVLYFENNLTQFKYDNRLNRLIRC